MTNHKTLFTSLAAPFERGQVKQKTETSRKTGKSWSCDYVTARTVMIRLDEVLGPENWWDDFTPLEHSVICRLTIRLPDGSLVTKVDAGGYAGMEDEGDDDKSGFADAFKRAAVKFGISRYLYRDGVATLTGSSPAPAAAEIPAELPTSTQISTGITPAPAAVAKDREITTGYQLYQWASKCRIDPRLIAWITMTFDRYPAKITNWSKDQVAAAQPKIKEYLEAKRAA